VKKRVAFAVAVVAALGIIALSAGCGSDNGSGNEAEARQRATRQQAYRLAAHRQTVRDHRAQAQARREATQRRARHIAAREQRARQQEEGERRALARQEEAEETAVEEEAAAGAAEESECDPNYSGACLSPTTSDYDCAGGSGDGPEYTGTVTVVGEDHYGLDSDGDEVGCEAE
jgi:hypothetical protein